MSRIRIALGLALVAVGVAWAVGGPDSLTSAARHAPRLLAAALVLAGVLTLARAALPPGSLAGPAVLIGLGGLVLAIELGAAKLDAVARVAPYVLVAGGALAAMTRPSSGAPISSPVWRYNAVFWLKRPAPPHGDGPHKVIVRAIFGTVELDLQRITYLPAKPTTNIDITVVAGRVVLVLPASWQVSTGRVEHVHGTRLVGDTDADPDPSATPQPPKVVLNMLGWGGSIRLDRMTTPGASYPTPAAGPA